jgi:chitin synthase
LANIWLTFSIIIELLPTQGVYAFGTLEVVRSFFEFIAYMSYTNLLHKTHWVNFALKLIYIFFLALQFVMALGNRPKGERVPYIVTLWRVNPFDKNVDNSLIS